MRRFRYCLIGFAVLALLVGASVAVYVTFIDRTYSGTEFYTETGLEPWRVDEGSIAGSEFVERPGRITFALSRGERHGIVTSYHGWNESLWIEITRPTDGERIEFGHPDVRAAFGANDGRHFAEVGDGGIQGSVKIVSVDETRIVAEYDVTADACFRSPYQPCFQHKTVVFHGRSTFRLRSRPDGQRLGDIWPRTGNQSPQKK